MKQHLGAQFGSRGTRIPTPHPRSLSSSQKSTMQPSTGDAMATVISRVSVTPSGMGQTWTVIKVGQNRN